MSRRMERINRHIQRILGGILLEQADIPPDVLVTVGRVDTTPNLQSSAVWLYIQPPQRGQEVLDILKGQLYELQGALNRELAMHPLPRITLNLDLGSEHAAHIEEKLAEIEDEDSAA